MLLAQDYTATALLPIGMNLGFNAFSLLNDLGIYLLILSIFIIKEFFDARQQGKDEGAPSVFALKQVERHFYSALAVFLLFWIPIKTPQSLSINPYKCNIYENSSTVGSLNGMTGENARMPIGWLIINNLSVGVSEALSSKLPCDDAFNSIKNSVSTSLIELDDKNLDFNIRQHYDQCFIPSQNRLAEAEAKNVSLIEDPYSVKNNYFFGYNSLNGYEGLNTSGGKRSDLMMNVKEDYWHYDKDSDYRTAETQDGSNLLAIPCVKAAAIIRDQISSNVGRKYSEEILRLFEINSAFPQTSEKNYGTVGEAKLAYIHQAYIDSATGKAQILNPDSTASGNSSRGLLDITVDTIKEFVASQPLFGLMDYFGWFSSVDSLDGQIVKKQTNKSIETFAYLGTQTERLIQAAKVESINRFLPVFITVVLAVIYAATPILLVLSGFSWKMIKALTFIVFTCHLTFYFLNLAHTMSSMMTSMANSSLGYFAANLSTNGAALNLVGSYTITVVILTWLALCVIVGLRLGPLLTSLLNVSGAAGEAGAKGAISIAKKAALKGK